MAKIFPFVYKNVHKEIKFYKQLTSCICVTKTNLMRHKATGNNKIKYFSM